jgi:hypothetical protein
VTASVVKSGGMKYDGRRARRSGEDSLRMVEVNKRKRATTVPE